MGCAVSWDTDFTVEELHGSRAGVHEPFCECWNQPRSKASLSLAEDVPALEDFSVCVHRGPGDVLGAGIGNTEKGAVILNVQKRGLLDRWNKANPGLALYPGCIITQVNGVAGYWSILEELHRPGELAMTVTTTPPKNAGPNWFQEIAEMGKNLKGGKSTFMLRLQPQDPKAKGQTFTSLPNVKAGDVGVDQCAICMEDVGAEEAMVQLPCTHAFHPFCAARWLTQAGRTSQGKRQCCPLCCRKVVSTADGGVSMVEDVQS